MVSKAGSGTERRLVCSDCGHGLRNHSKPTGDVISKRSQLITVVLIALFGITAGGLMTLKDQQNPSLLEDEPLNLQEPRQSERNSHRFNSVLPRTAAFRD